MKESSQYTSSFFKHHSNGSYLAAQHVIPIVNSLFHPESVVDIGCGTGFWLKVWKEEIRVKKVLGVDGPYVDPTTLEVPSDLVLFQDLKEPINLGQRFDVATSFEVAEHLPPEKADHFVRALTNLSDIIVFSAALTGQGGTYHLNEQTPEYWAELFLKYDYIPVDYIRPLIWNIEGIPYWYKQNIVIYIKKAKMNEMPPEVKSVAGSTNPGYLLRVHPEQYFKLYERRKWPKFIHYNLYMVKKFFKER